MFFVPSPKGLEVKAMVCRLSNSFIHSAAPSPSCHGTGWWWVFLLLKPQEQLGIFNNYFGGASDIQAILSP